MSNVAPNVLGTIGTVFWCVQLIPQIWYNWRRKETEGLPPLMMFLWAACTPHLLDIHTGADADDDVGAPPMGAYLILQVNILLPTFPGKDGDADEGGREYPAANTAADLCMFCAG